MQLAALVYGRAQTCGLSEILDGIDGDLVFGIHAPYLPLLVRRGHVATFIRELWATNRRRSEGWRLLARSVVANVLNALPSALHVWRRPGIVKNASQLCAKSIVRTEFARRHGVVERMEALRAFSPPTDDFRRLHVAWVEHPFAVVGMERYERVAAPFGIRPRHPIFDVQLLEYCVNLPWNLRTREGWSKYGLRKAMTRSLPAETCWRRDWDNLYPRVVEGFLQTHAGLLGRFAEHGLEQHREIFDVERIRQDMRHFSAGDRSAGWLVWQAFYLSKWLESA
jgi:asparagine synthase (glutamine-hydrolysing)